MNTWLTHSALLLVTAVCYSPRVALSDTAIDPVPVAPIPATQYRSWSNAFVLQNSEVKVVIVPEIGRIAHIGFLDGENLLRAPDSVLVTEESGGWANQGGDWLWPVAQSHWPLLQDGIWPPGALLGDSVWTGRAWRAEDGSRHCLFTREYGDPLHVRVTRTISLGRTNAHMTVRQRVQRTQPSDIPVTLWQLSQIEDADMIVMPIDESSRFDAGMVPLLFDMPPDSALAFCGDTVVYDARYDGEHKLGSDSERSWIAALKDNQILLQRAKPGNGDGAFPNDGLTVQLYANREYRYGEIETLSIEAVLAPEEYLDNTLHITLHRLKDVPTDACAVAGIVRQLLGEQSSHTNTAAASSD